MSIEKLKNIKQPGQYKLRYENNKFKVTIDV